MRILVALSLFLAFLVPTVNAIAWHGTGYAAAGAPTGQGVLGAVTSGNAAFVAAGTYAEVPLATAFATLGRRALGQLGRTPLARDIGVGIGSREPPAQPLRLGEIVHEFPCPGTDPRGLTWDGTHLWHVDDDSGLIYKLNPTNGSVLASFAAPGVSDSTHRQGLAWDGDVLFHAEYFSGLVYRLDPVSGSVMSSFVSPTTTPCGLTWDGEALWTTSYIDDKIYRFSATDGTLCHSLDPPDDGPWGVAWTGSTLWHGTFGLLGQPQFELNPGDGSVIRSFTSPHESYFLGMTWDGSALWVVDHAGRRIIRIEVDDGPVHVSEMSWGKVKSLWRR
jgi:streptogramin lyase